MIKVGKSTVIAQDNGQYGFKLIEGWLNKDGDFKPNFCKRQFGKDAPERNVPVSIGIGENAKDAATNLRRLADQVENMDVRAADDDVPF